jgi:hypothetical protein
MLFLIGSGMVYVVVLPVLCCCCEKQLIIFMWERYNSRKCDLFIVVQTTPFVSVPSMKVLPT